MKLKKLLATTLALALALSPVNVFASELTAPGTSEGSVSGNVDYLDTVVYKVALPTTQNLSFLLDPQGLASADGSGVSINNLTGAGKVVGKGVATAVNKSSVPIVLSCKMYLSAKDTTKAPTGITLISGNASSITQSANEARITICPLASGNAIPVSVNSGSWVPAAEQPIYATSKAAANEIRFALGAADYVVKISANGSKTYVPNDAAGATVSDNTAFCISGNVAKNADWKELANTEDPLKLNAVFSFAGIKALGVTADYETGSKMLTKSATVETLSPADITVAKNATNNIQVTLAGTFRSMTVDTFNGNTINQAASAGKQYAANPTTQLTFLGTWTNAITSNATFTVTLTDGQTQKITITAN